jgi:hypothetical protein
MQAPWSSYLPWGENASSVAMALFFVAIVGFAIGVVGDQTSSEAVLGLGGVVVALSTLVGCVFILVALPFNAVRIWRAFREAWNRPPINRHEDWKP